MLLHWKALPVILKTFLGIFNREFFNKALDFRTQKTTKVETWEEFKEVIQNKGGFVSAHWDGTPETEDKIKNETKATIRCIPLENELEEGKCIYSGKPSKQCVLFALAY
jgi:prolyl-tRNA synthetase